jgi:hypothetical protein
MKKMQRASVIDAFSSMTSPSSEEIEMGILHRHHHRECQTVIVAGNPISLSSGNRMVLPRFCSVAIVAMTIRPGTSNPPFESIRRPNLRAVAFLQ